MSFTRQAMNKLPESAKNRIEYYRNNAKTDQRYRELYISKSSGYIQCLIDTGIITESDGKCIRAYITI